MRELGKTIVIEKDKFKEALASIGIQTEGFSISHIHALHPPSVGLVAVELRDTALEEDLRKKEQEYYNTKNQGSLTSAPTPIA